MILLKARALKQLINQPKKLKHTNPPKQVTQQHQLRQVLQITQNFQDKYSRVIIANSTSTQEQQDNFIDVTREERNKQGTFLIKEERDAEPDNSSATKMMKGGAAQVQKVLEVPRSENEEESIGEIV